MKNQEGLERKTNNRVTDTKKTYRTIYEICFSKKEINKQKLRCMKLY